MIRLQKTVLGVGNGEGAREVRTREKIIARGTRPVWLHWLSADI